MVVKLWIGPALVSAAYFRRTWPAALLVVLFAGASCSLADGDSEPDHDQAVVATGQHCVDDDPARGCQAATVVSSESDLANVLNLWGYAAEEVDFDGETLVFVGVDESSSCPAQVDGVVLTHGVLDVTISTLGSDDCTSDAAHRSFIIRVTADGPIDAVTVNGTQVELLSS